MAPQHPSRSPLLPWLAIALVVFVLDQLTKAMVIGAFELGDARRITSFFNLVRVHNSGAAFSLLAGASGWQRWFFIGLGTAAAAIMIWLLRSQGHQRLFGWSLSLILGGAVGNVVDRVLHGHVIDFLDFHWRGMHFPSFNVADAAISVGAALLIIDELRRMRRG